MFRLGYCCSPGQASNTVRREITDTGIRPMTVVTFFLFIVAIVSGSNAEVEEAEQGGGEGGGGLPDRGGECGHAGFRPSRVTEEVSPSKWIGRWPWMVSIYRDGNFACSGVLITDRHILTSASCLHVWNDDSMSNEISPPGSLKVMLGVYNLTDYNNPNIQWNTVSNVSVPREFNNSEPGHDIAVLKVMNNVEMVPKVISAVCLPKEAPEDIDQMDYMYNNAIVTGWDSRFRGQASMSGDLMKQSYVKFWMRKECKEICPKQLDRSEICARSNDEETCIGNYGEPLIKMMDPLRWKLIGISSRVCSSPCSRSSYIYTRVGYYLPFINSCISEQSDDVVTTEGVAAGDVE